MPTSNDPQYIDIGPAIIDCPACGERIPVEPYLPPHDPTHPKIIARHACCGLPLRDVYESDLPDQPALPEKE